MTYAERLRLGWITDPSDYRQGKKPKARCPVCGRNAPVNRGSNGRPGRSVAGTLGWHAPRLGQGRTECPGTGSEPVE